MSIEEGGKAGRRLNMAEAIEATEEYAGRYAVAWHNLASHEGIGREYVAAREIVARVRLEEAVRREERLADEDRTAAAIGRRLQEEIADSIRAEDPDKLPDRARIQAFASVGYMVEKATGVPYKNPLGHA